MTEVLKCGLYDTIQDLGRYGVQEFGVPLSGAMDLLSAQVANTIVGNSKSLAVMEITLVGPKLKFHCDTEMALAGADLSPKLNSKLVKMNSRVRIYKNDILTFGKRNYGCRAYIAVKGGFQISSVMNSYSMYKPITSKSQLNKGDFIPLIENSNFVSESFASMRIEKKHFEICEIEVFRGLEFNRLSSEEKVVLFSTEFTISKDSNRMAYQIKELLPNKLESIITSLVLPGTVQLTPSGRLLFLMRDCQVTGGYPRILHVSEQSINRLSQKISGDKFRLKCID